MAHKTNLTIQPFLVCFGGMIKKPILIFLTLCLQVFYMLLKVCQIGLDEWNKKEQVVVQYIKIQWISMLNLLNCVLEKYHHVKSFILVTYLYPSYYR